jgi:hypothetical protein
LAMLCSLVRVPEIAGRWGLREGLSLMHRSGALRSDLACPPTAAGVTGVAPG